MSLRAGSSECGEQDEGGEDNAWQVQLFRACRDGNLDFIRILVNARPFAIHEHFCEDLADWQLEWESLQWYEFIDATCLYIAASYCQDAVVEWLLYNGVDREKACYHSQKPFDVIGQCRSDRGAAATIREMLSQALRLPRAPATPTCTVKLGFEETVRKEYELVSTGKGTKRIPKRITETVATCKVTVSWPSYWLSDITRDGKLGGGVSYELQYRSRVGQDWISIQTKTPNKIITGLSPGVWHDFRVRAVNSAGWGEFSRVTELLTPGSAKKSTRKAADGNSEASVD